MINPQKPLRLSVHKPELDIEPFSSGHALLGVLGESLGSCFIVTHDWSLLDCSSEKDTLVLGVFVIDPDLCLQWYSPPWIPKG